MIVGSGADGRLDHRRAVRRAVPAAPRAGQPADRAEDDEQRGRELDRHRLRLPGPAFVVNSACASATRAIGIAAEAHRVGRGRRRRLRRRRGLPGRGPADAPGTPWACWPRTPAVPSPPDAPGSCSPRARACWSSNRPSTRRARVSSPCPVPRRRRWSADAGHLTKPCRRRHGQGHGEGAAESRDRPRRRSATSTPTAPGRAPTTPPRPPRSRRSSARTTCRSCLSTRGPPATAWRVRRRRGGGRAAGHGERGGAAHRQLHRPGPTPSATSTACPTSPENTRSPASSCRTRSPSAASNASARLRAGAGERRRTGRRPSWPRARFQACTPPSTAHHRLARGLRLRGRPDRSPDGPVAGGRRIFLPVSSSSSPRHDGLRLSRGASSRAVHVDRAAQTGARVVRHRDPGRRDHGGGLVPDRTLPLLDPGLRGWPTLGFYPVFLLLALWWRFRERSPARTW